MKKEIENSKKEDEEEKSFEEKEMEITEEFNKALSGLSLLL